MSLFNEGTDQVTFDALVGEGKKYKDADAAAKAIVEKDRFIEQLKAEKAEVLRDVQTRQPVSDRSQEILDRLEQLARKPVTETPVTTPSERTEYKGLTEADIERVLSQREAKARTDNNVAQVKAELVKKYGDKYSQVLDSLQEKLGVDQKFLDNLAAQSPAAFLNLLPQQSRDPVFTPPATSQQQRDFKPTGGGPQPRSAYTRMKAENYALYNSPAVQNQMYKDSMALGEAFFDTND